MRNIQVRPFAPKTEKRLKQLLDDIRWGYMPADLEVPKGYSAPGVETAVAEKVVDGRQKFVSALTATLAVILDPLINSPASDITELDLMNALIKLEAALTYKAQISAGAVDAYIAIPDALPAYQKLVQKYGYQPTVEHCTVFRRPLQPDTEELIGATRDRLASEATLETPLESGSDELTEPNAETPAEV